MSRTRDREKSESPTGIEPMTFCTSVYYFNCFSGRGRLFLREAVESRMGRNAAGAELLN